MSFRQAMYEVDEFFMKRGRVHETLERIARRLADQQVPYAVLGGMAMTAHGFVRPTDDVDILTTADGLETIHRQLVGRGYVPAFPGARKTLRDTDTGVKVDFITAGEYPGDGKPKPVRFPDPADASVQVEGKSVIMLPKLIELKLASGSSASHRMRDLSDVQDLIAALALPRSLGDSLDASVRDEYFRIWDAAQTPDALKE
jgi:hypothetical protein